MTILVVGGAGYIGSHAARSLCRHGEKVILYDNLSTGHRSLAAEHELIVAELTDTDALTAALHRVDAVMHFAAFAYVGESVENPKKYFQNNVVAGLHLLDHAIQCGVRNFVFSSSCAVYGVPSQTPITEDLPREPVNPYGASKLFFERALSAYQQAYGLRYASLRYFNAAGADEGGKLGEMHDPETHLIPLALAAASGAGPALSIYGDDYPTPDGTCVRDFIHVNDLAEAHVLALQNIAKTGQSHVLNLGSGKGHSIREVIATVEQVTGRKVPVKIAPRRAGDPPALVADPSRAEQVLGWKAQRSLHAIVSTAWNWMQNRQTTGGKDH
jgi:UDP-glucose-4-epimerase GalE